MRNVTVNEILEILASGPTRGAKQATLLTETFPPMLVKDRVTGEANPHVKGVSRLAYRHVTLGANYEACVNRQRCREDDTGPIEYFDALELWNGKGVYHTPYSVTHKDKGGVYFACRPAQRPADTEQGSVAVVIQDRWRDVASGKFVDPATLSGLLPKPSKSNRQQVRADVLWRTFDLKHVLEIHYGDVYNIVH